MAIIYAEMLNHQWLNLPKILMKFCSIIPVYTAQQTEAHKRQKLPPKAPDRQLCDEMSSHIPSLYKTPDYYWDSRNLEAALSKKQQTNKNHTTQTNKKTTLKMTIGPSCFSFAVIFLKGSSPTWDLKLPSLQIAFWPSACE